MFKKPLIAAAIALAAGQANANSAFSELIVFGDSLLDSGNFGIRFTNRVGDGAGDFTSGEFAPIAPQLFAESLGLEAAPVIFGGSNYAVGGFNTIQILDSVAGAGIAIPTGSTNAYLADNPSVASDTLVLIDGGGNDFLQGLATDQDSITASAQRLTAAVAALDAAGAKYIVLSNLPDLGLTAGSQAANVASPGFAETVSAGASGFNTLQSIFSNALDANIILLDLAGSVTFIRENAEVFGIASGPLGGFDQLYMCFDDSNGDCLEHPIYGIDGANPDPRRLMFNDSVHPTAIVSELTGDLLADIITAPQVVGLLPEMAIDMARNQSQVAGDELRRSRWQVGESRWFIAGNLATAEFEGGSAESEFDGQGLSLGYIHQAGDQTSIGLMLTLAQRELSEGATDFEADSIGFTGMLSWNQDNRFVDITIGLSEISYDDANRAFVFGPSTYVASGDTEGMAWSADVLLGYNLMGDDSSLKLGPALGLSWIDAEVDAYTETGGEISNYAWGEQSRESQQWRLGVVGSAELSEGFNLYGEVFAAVEQEDDLHTISVTNTNLNYGSYSLPSFETESDSFVQAAVGGSLGVGGGSVNLTYAYSGFAEGIEQLVVSFSKPI